MSVIQLRKDDFYLPILRLLDSLGGSVTIEQMEQRLIEEFAFTEADLAAAHDKSGTPVIPNKIAWSRSYLKQAGWRSPIDAGDRRDREAARRSRRDRGHAARRARVADGADPPASVGASR